MLGEFCKRKHAVPQSKFIERADGTVRLQLFSIQINSKSRYLESGPRLSFDARAVAIFQKNFLISNLALWSEISSVEDLHKQHGA